MFLSEKVTYRLKRTAIGIAMGMAIWLLYTGCLFISNAVSTHTPMGNAEFVLTPIAPILK